MSSPWSAIMPDSELNYASISVLWSFVGLPADLKYSFFSWNSMTHGNITFTTFLCAMRYVNSHSLSQSESHVANTRSPATHQHFLVPRNWKEALLLRPAGIQVQIRLTRGSQCFPFSCLDSTVVWVPISH